MMYTIESLKTQQLSSIFFFTTGQAKSMKTIKNNSISKLLISHSISYPITISTISNTQHITFHITRNIYFSNKNNFEKFSVHFPLLLLDKNTTANKRNSTGKSEQEKRKEKERKSSFSFNNKSSTYSFVVRHLKDNVSNELCVEYELKFKPEI